MKKSLSLLMVIIILLTMGNVKKVQAKEITPSNTWIANALSDYQPLQTLLIKYPNAICVQDNTTYILNEAVKDKNGNLLDLKQKKFSNLSDLEKYEKSAKILNQISPYTVGSGQTKEKVYSKIKVGLVLYKYNSQEFFVACVYEWLDGFDYDLLFNYKAVVGLALGSGLSMNGSSYGGRYSFRTPDGNTTMKNNSNGGLTIKATSTSGIGYSIKENAISNGLILDMQGVISCTALKTQPSINYCTAYGEYAAVSYSLDLNNFSVSIPAGISFNTNTQKTSYSYQDTLDVR